MRPYTAQASLQQSTILVRVDHCYRDTIEFGEAVKIFQLSALAAKAKETCLKQGYTTIVRNASN